MNCSVPADFGEVALGSTATQIVTCTAYIPITISNVVTGNPFFNIDQSSLPTGRVQAGQSFSFSITRDLVGVQVTNTANASYGYATPGIKSTPLTITTINGTLSYTKVFPLSLIGTDVSVTPLLIANPKTFGFGGVIVLDSVDVKLVSGIVTLTNNGLMDVVIDEYGYEAGTPDGGSIIYANSTFIGNNWDLGYGFTAPMLPCFQLWVAPFLLKHPSLSILSSH